MNVVTDMIFPSFSTEHYIQRHECPRCHGQLKIGIIEGCTNSKEASCACGYRHYLFFKEKSDASMKSNQVKSSGPKEFKTRQCVCHKVLGGPPCKVTFLSKAGNALYCKEHSRAAKDKVNRDKRAREKMRVKR